MENNMKSRVLIMTFIILSLTLVWVIQNYQKASQKALLDRSDPITLKIKWGASNNNYNSVGNSWDYQAAINGEKVPWESPAEYVVTSDAMIPIIARAEERDNYPDVGISRGQIDVSKLNLASITHVHLNVEVREGHGRYAGRVTHPHFIYTVERIITIRDILNHFF
ncbi:hypothetical protein [Paenibacillus mucilaginosus]|uniref:hypothetical protein n=1 Tax=Paenibacillus mucilaginosus TaxID=61624 RepID=UPI00059F416B|nr:hypothetical protein [Paenibacillus mucilaginosus]MCG7217882.1 hypothetical protein [Paenibacillus mucilaginosus]WDM29092.1 hypothetical protein KCX80_07980 [Paenibacillus mucilaginosus]